jgi:hypothetical protein
VARAGTPQHVAEVVAGSVIPVEASVALWHRGYSGDAGDFSQRMSACISFHSSVQL